MRNRLKYSLVGIFLLIFLSQNVNAEIEFEFYHLQNSTIKYPVYLSNSSLCTACTFTLSINYPNGSAMLSGVSMSNSGGYAVYNINGSLLSVLGVYNAYGESSEIGGNLESGFVDPGFQILVKPLKPATETGSAILNIGLIIVLIVLFVTCLVSLRYSEKIWLTTLFMGLSYIILIGIFFISWTTAEGFLQTNSFLKSFFEIGFYILMIGFFPFILGLTIWCVYMMITIKQIQNLVEKGVPEDEAYERSVRNRGGDVRNG